MPSGADYEALGYDPAGNVTSFRNRAGETIGYGYDDLGRLVSKDRPGAEPDVGFGYDNLGRLVSATQANETMSFA